MRIGARRTDDDVLVVYSGDQPTIIDGVLWTPGVPQPYSYAAARAIVGRNNLRLRLSSMTRPDCVACDAARRRTGDPA